MSQQQISEAESKLPHFCTLNELECRICYNCYDVHSRKPKVLNCHHRVCAKCLQKVAKLKASPPHTISCPFCRQETNVPKEKICRLQDDPHIMAILSLPDKAKNCSSSEITLTPANHEISSNSSNCLLIAITDPQRESLQTNNTNVLPIISYRPSSLDSLTSISCQQVTDKCRPCLWKGFPHLLTWTLGLFYFSSVPLGIYLLVIQKVTLGIIFISLVPSSLVLCVVYGFCQCVFHETLHCLTR
ncbi:E3 ubiquitin-protein ligase RNF182 [Carcharodon carcharias]|uniref:E3 ubiquitin-protein ligase RNF182 n=1 Tax=Carcharodon carcharias TaxID=13397 RepID=UPI001B7D95E5|nr:E3 ubiquitin-protein ligase RNF182 [Carcharodon carcharias]XP_041060841.1 E3 ubiquitin-protein ligase RNF182 [Carcharodon carcharias]